MSHTGIAGLTLGGGDGWLMRRHGLTIDNLFETEVVAADGQVLIASEDEHADLFWGLRGGGGNVGIVTSFTYRLHSVGPDVLAGPVLWAMEDASEVLRFYREYVSAAPRELASVVILRRDPEAPFLPIELHGRPVCIIGVCWLGDPQAGERVLAPLRTFGRPLLDLVDLHPYTCLQSSVDATARHGWHYYGKSSTVGPLDDALVDVLVEHAGQARSPRSVVLIDRLGGAVADVEEDAPRDIALDHVLRHLLTSFRSCSCL